MGGERSEGKKDWDGRQKLGVGYRELEERL
jgi:hypothetical protein